MVPPIYIFRNIKAKLMTKLGIVIHPSDYETRAFPPKVVYYNYDRYPDLQFFLLISFPENAQVVLYQSSLHTVAGAVADSNRIP
jgi:hypothetical protein